MKKTDKIFIAGHKGLVGSEIKNIFLSKGFKKIITKNRKEVDLTNQLQVENFFKKNRLDVAIIAAAKVGGIYANNTFPADFIYQNLMIQSNIIHSAYSHGCKKIIFLGSSCIYPRMAKQPLKEKYLLSGSLEPTNTAYAIAKIAGLIMCESYNKQYIKKKIDFRSIMPTNLYGNRDNYHPKNSHVIPALIRKFHNAKKNQDKEIYLWGTGKAKREFLHASDLARAVYTVLKTSRKKYLEVVKKDFNHINVGYGKDHTIFSLAQKIKKITNYQGKILFNNKSLEGTPRKKMDNKRIFKLGWRPLINLNCGLKNTYKDFLKNYV
mgnify:CR=1 FL=1